MGWPAWASRLEAEQVRQRRLGAFDLRREHRLLADVHVEEELLPRQKDGDAVETAKRTLRGAEAVDEAEDVDGGLRGQGRGHKRPHDFARDRRLDETAEPLIPGVRLSHQRSMTTPHYLSKVPFSLLASELR